MTVFTTATPDRPTTPPRRAEDAENFLRAVRAVHGRDGQAPASPTPAKSPEPPGLADDFDPKNFGTILDLALRSLRAQPSPGPRSQPRVTRTR